jgi:hypothetical protein
LRIAGVENLSVKWGVVHYGIYVKPGETIAQVTDHTKHVGFVIATDRDRREAVYCAQDAVRSVHFEVSET